MDIDVRTVLADRGPLADLVNYGKCVHLVVTSGGYPLVGTLRPCTPAVRPPPSLTMWLKESRKGHILGWVRPVKVWIPRTDRLNNGDRYRRDTEQRPIRE